MLPRQWRPHRKKMSMNLKWSPVAGEISPVPLKSYYGVNRCLGGRDGIVIEVLALSTRSFKDTVSFRREILRLYWGGTRKGLDGKSYLHSVECWPKKLEMPILSEHFGPTGRNTLHPQNRGPLSFFGQIWAHEPLVLGFRSYRLEIMGWSEVLSNIWLT